MAHAMSKMGLDTGRDTLSHTPTRAPEAVARKVVQQWTPTQGELNKMAKDCAKSLKKRVKSGDLGGWTKVV